MRAFLLKTARLLIAGRAGCVAVFLVVAFVGIATRDGTAPPASRTITPARLLSSSGPALSTASGFPVDEVGGSTPVSWVGVTWANPRDLVVVVFDLNYTSSEPAVSSISANLAGPFSKVGSYTDTSGDANRRLEVWEGVVGTTGWDNLSIAYNGSGSYYEVAVDELSSALPSTPTWSLGATAGASGKQFGSGPQRFFLPALTSSSAAVQGYVGWAVCSQTGSVGTTTGFSYYLSPANNLLVFDGSLKTNTTYQPTAFCQDPSGTPTESSIALIVSASSLPGAPTGVTATPGSASATVAWTAPPDGGSPITSYTVMASPGGVTASVPGTSVSATIGGLTSGQAYTFTVTATNALGSGAPSSPSNSVTPTDASPMPNSVQAGYWMVDSAGHVYAFGSSTYYGGATAYLVPGSSVVGICPTPDGQGYWLVANTGAVYAFGDATYVGGSPTLMPGEHVVSLSATSTGRGYWLATSMGRVFAFGDAASLGSISSLHLNSPIVGSAAAPSVDGDYLVGADGGVFALGGAPYLGSMGGASLNGPVVGIGVSPGTAGYWLVANDGGVFAFGSARFLGSMGGTRLNAPVVGMVPFGNGYLLVAADGGIFDFSSYPFLGSMGAHPPPAPVRSAAGFP
ncbi:MAG TPA: fibronectin type III domain-containing protein [Acidimicrobiales bacterium]|nr:fibronectin type III domain-containing protein [Acidimicrobiales bacterium]